jgi:RND family efflux transporter MFP subunit
MTVAKRYRVGLVVVAVAIVALLASCSQQAAEEVDSETVVSVKTAPAKVGSIRGVVHATGVVTPAPGAELMVNAPEAARIAEVPPAAGDRVRRGDVLVRFEIPTLTADVERQRAEIHRAEAALETARAAQTRARELFERGVAARREVEDANRAAADAEAALTQARSSLAASEALAARATVRATFDGIVAKRFHNPGDFVEPTASDPVLRVVDPRRLEVVASVPLADASRVQVGASAHLAAAPANTTPLDLKVVSGPSAVEIGTPTIPERLGFFGRADIAVGTPVEVDIDAEQHSNVVIVPSVAIVREAEETAVFVAMEGKAQRRVVQIGITDGTHTEIVSGVKAGEMVIVDGQAGLPDGAAISTGNEEDPPEPPPPTAAPKDAAK